MTSADTTAMASNQDQTKHLLAQAREGKITAQEALSRISMEGNGGSVLTTLLQVAAQQLRDEPGVKTAESFLELIVNSTRLSNQKSADARALGWTVLREAVGDADGPLAPARWSERALSKLRVAIGIAPESEMPRDVKRDLTFGLAAALAPSARVIEQLNGSEVDYMVGQFLDSMWLHENRQMTPALAEATVQAIEVAPRAVHSLELDPDRGPLLTRSIADRALELLAEDDPVREKLKARLPLDWLTKEEALQQIQTKPLDLYRLAQYATADLAHTQAAMERVLAHDFSFHTDIGLHLIPQLPKIKDLVDGTEWAREAVSVDVENDLCPVIRHLAALQTDPDRGHELLVLHATSKVQAAQQAQDERTQAPVWDALQTLRYFMGSDPQQSKLYAPLLKPLTLEDISGIVRSTDLQFTQYDQCYRHSQPWARDIEWSVRDLNLSAQERDGLLSLYVEKGVIDIGDLTKQDLRQEVVGAALQKNPALLFQVESRAIAKRLTQELNLQADPSSDEAAAAQRRDRALSAIDDGNAALKKSRAPGA